MSHRCSSPQCQRPIIWVVTAATKKTTPLDQEPTPNGNVWIRDGFAVVYRDAKAAFLDGAPPDELRTSHFATCPEAARFRAAKQSKVKP